MEATMISQLDATLKSYAQPIICDMLYIAFRCDLFCNKMGAAVSERLGHEFLLLTISL